MDELGILYKLEHQHWGLFALSFNQEMVSYFPLLCHLPQCYIIKIQVLFIIVSESSNNFLKIAWWGMEKAANNLLMEFREGSRKK